MSATIAGLPVVSHFLPQETPAADIAPELGLSPEVTGVVSAFSTRIANKTILTGIGIGGIKDGQLMMTDIARTVLKTLHEHGKSNRLILCPCENPKTARARACTALLAAGDGDMLFILAADTHIVDAVFITKTFGWEP